MCYSCYEEAGSPSIVTDKTIAVANLIKRLHSTGYGIVGGNLHVVLDDWNLEDKSLQWCIDVALPENNAVGTDKQLELEKAILNGLMQCTQDERYSVLAISEDIIKV